MNTDAIRPSATASLIQISGREVEGGQACAAPRQDHGSHAVAAAVIEYVQSLQRVELFEGGADPRLVIQIGIILELQLLRLSNKRGRSLPRLLVVKDLLTTLAIRRAHVRHPVL